jgi:hypothetical protein
MAQALQADFRIVEDRSITIERATVYMLVLAVPLVVVQAAAFSLVWGWPALTQGLNDLVRSPIGLLALLLGIGAHELIHGLAWMLFGGLQRHQLRFGFQLKTLSPYAHALVPLRARAYRLGAVMPLLLLGILPHLLGMAGGDGRLAVFGILYTLAAGGDMAILWLLRGVPARAWLQDHPSRAGCYIVAPASP